MDDEQQEELLALASLHANVQEQDAYEDHVIFEATLQLAPTLTGVGLPSLEGLLPPHQQNQAKDSAAVATALAVLSETLRQLEDGDNHDKALDKSTKCRLLLLQVQVLRHYLTTCLGVPEHQLPRYDGKSSNASPSASGSAARMASATSGGLLLHKRVPLMQRKRQEAQTSVVNAAAVGRNGDERDDDGSVRKDKEALQRLRQERLERRAKRRQQWNSDDDDDGSCSSAEDSENEFTGTEESDDKTDLPTGTDGGIEQSQEDGNRSDSATAVCPLCQELVRADGNPADVDRLLAQHMDQCQRRGGRTSRRSSRAAPAALQATTAVQSNAERGGTRNSGAAVAPSDPQRPTKRRKKQSAARKRRLASASPAAIDDFQESHYEDRVDDWIEHGLDGMKDMKERDSDEELPGAETYKGLHVPAWMNDRLFGYQRTALRWMWDLHQQETGGILGDEMGLGKTVQVCAYLGALAATRKLKSVLIVAPATMLRHWLSELAAWAPGMRRILIHQSGELDGESRSISTRMLLQLARWLQQCRADRVYEVIDEQDLETMPPHSFCGTGYAIVTTYENLRRNSDVYTNHTWSYVVLDEAQKIRNPDADVTLACKRIRTPHRIAMSGTPIQNDLRELWSLFDFAFPGCLGALPTFEQEFSDPIRRGGYSNASPMQVQLAYRCALTLKELIDPYLLRRRKREVKEVARMPAKTEHVLFCRLSLRQRLMYESYLQSDEVQRVVRGTGQLLAAVTMLRKICNHPDLVIDPDQASLDSFLKMGTTAVAEGSDDDDEMSDDEIVSEETLMDRAGKLEVLAKILPLWRKQGHRCLIFCQWTKMLNILQRFMMLKGWKFARLDGKTQVASRQRLVDTFNNDDSYFCMLCTTRTGGVGLNLTGANRIILYDPDFNPQTDAQARERAWRFGQEREVTVYRLISAGTVEEKIYHRQIFKTALSNSVLQDPRQRRLFSQRDLKDLFTLKADTGSLRGGGDGVTETSAATRGVGLVEDAPAEASKDDEETLKNVMKSKGLAGIFDHGFVEQESLRKSITQREMEDQAKEVARKAVTALRQSVHDRNRFEPTWTGSEVAESRFGASKAPVIRGGGASSAGSSGLLASLRQRQAAVESGGLNAPLDEESQKYAQLLIQIQDFVQRRRPTTDELLQQFEETHNFDLTVFRQLLKSVAIVEQGTWRLK